MEDEPPSKKQKKKQIQDNDLSNLTSCDDCEGWSSQERASFDRSCLKKEVEKFKQRHGGSFEVHLILSKPVDDGGAFMEMASQPGAVE